MNAIDLILIAAIAVGFGLALRKVIGNLKSVKCSCCSEKGCCNGNCTCKS